MPDRSAVAAPILWPLPNLWFSSAPLQSRSDILGSTLSVRQWVKLGGSKPFLTAQLYP